MRFDRLPISSKFIKFLFYVSITLIALVFLTYQLITHNLLLVYQGPDNWIAITTILSDKPRDKILLYKVAKNDSLASLANKYNISEDTIRWANNLTNDNLEKGTTLQILPVTGVMHKVTENETIYTIAARYQTTPDKIVNYPFNHFKDVESFDLTPGQILIVPDGIIIQNVNH